jgi:hypothetical protein
MDTNKLKDAIKQVKNVIDNFFISLHEQEHTADVKNVKSV